MPVELKEQSRGRILEVRVTGKLAASDYEHFAPAFDRLNSLSGDRVSRLNSCALEPDSMAHAK